MNGKTASPEKAARSMRGNLHSAAAAGVLGGLKQLVSHHPSLPATVVVATLVLGGLAWLRPHHKTTNLPVGDLPSLDYFVRISSNPSFSEVQNAKDLLKADCLRFLNRLQIQWMAGRNVHTKVPAWPGPAKTAISDPVRCREFVEAITKRIEDYGALDDQSLLYHQLFEILQAAGLYDQWLDTYLRLLYERPILPLLSRCANIAVELAAKTHRTPEVSRAFALVMSIPLDFSGKQTIEALAQKLRSEEQEGAPWANQCTDMISAVL